MTRQQLATILYRYAKMTGADAKADVAGGGFEAELFAECLEIFFAGVCHGGSSCCQTFIPLTLMRSSLRPLGEACIFMTWRISEWVMVAP